MVNQEPPGPNDSGLMMINLYLHFEVDQIKPDIIFPRLSIDSQQRQKCNSDFQECDLKQDHIIKEEKQSYLFVSMLVYLSPCQLQSMGVRVK